MTVHKEISNQLWTAGALLCTDRPLILTHHDAYHLAKCPRWRNPPIPELYGKISESWEPLEKLEWGRL